MSYRKEIFTNKNIYYMKNWEGKFFNSMLENLKYQINNNPIYRMFLENENFEISYIKDISDLYKIPIIPTLYFKSSTIYSTSKDKLKWILTSSGTSGTTSEVGYDRKSIYYGVRAGLNVFSYKNIITLRPSNYIVLGYEPSKENKMGAVKSAYYATKLSPAINRTYALVYRNNKYEVNMDGVIDALKEYSKSNIPVRFVGFPSYVYLLVEKLKEKKLKLKFNKNSKIIIGGGWKEFSNKEIEKEEFYKIIYEVLGIKKENIIEFFSVVEHPISYLACENGNFHVPIHSKVIVRDPKTLKPVEDGKLGILNFLTPLVESMPILSIATDDIGYMYSEKECGCGVKSPYFKIKNRTGISKIKTCVEQALEL